MVVVISWDSGEVLDSHVLSRYCGQCELRVHWDRSSEAYKQWYEGHKDHCQMTHAGSSPAMEARGVLHVFSRSVSHLGLQYTTVISDGDSKAMAVLHAHKPYGDTQIVKHECVEHV